LKIRITMAISLFTVLGVTSLISCHSCYANDKLHTGSRYKIVKPLYLVAVYDSLNNRHLGVDTARAYLEAVQLAKRSYQAFQCEVPAGTIMTIIGPAPKVWHIPFFADRYFVQLEPDVSRGLEVILELSRGIEGGVDGLNPEFFSR